MQLEIDPLSEVALYQQLRDRVVEGIASGQLRVGDQLAPVRTLAAQFGINVATVGKAYDLLRSEGLVRTNRTSGSVVARAPHDDGTEGTGPAALEGVGAWDGAARDAWARRLATVLAEGVAQGEQDAAIDATVHAIVKSFAASRTKLTDGRQSQEGSADEH